MLLLLGYWKNVPVCLIKIDSIAWTHLTLSDIDWDLDKNFLPKQEQKLYWKCHGKHSV